MEQPKTNIKLAFAAVLLILAVALPKLVLQGAKSVSLTDAPALTGQISLAFTNDASHTLPQPGKDYVLTNTRYFDGNDWVVTGITAKGQLVTDGMVVLHKQDGIYRVAMGPGSSFPSTQASALPGDVQAYLGSIGAVYEPL